MGVRMFGLCCAFFRRFSRFLLGLTSLLGELPAGFARRFLQTLQLFRGEFRQASNETHEIPDSFGLVLRTPRGHSCKPNAVIDDVVQLAITKLLCISGGAHIGNLRVEVLANKSIAVSIYSMTHS